MGAAAQVSDGQAMEDLIASGLSVVVALILLGFSLRRVPQGQVGLVERFGRYQRTLKGGIHFVIPFVEWVRHRVDVREQVITYPPKQVVTRDNLAVTVESAVTFRVTDARAAIHEVTDYLRAVEELVDTALADLVGDLDVSGALTARTSISKSLRETVSSETTRWGVEVGRAEIRAIEPPAAVREVMERKVRAEEERRTALVEAEAEREIAAIRASGENPLPAQPQTPAAHSADGPGSTALVPSGFQPTTQPLEADDPRQLGRYTLTARLGAGGMGAVYLGRSPGGRTVAIKVIHRELVAEASFRQRFAREIESVRRVGGYYTAPVVDADPDGATPWLVTEYIPGPTLGQVLQHYGPLPIRSVTTLAAGIAEALDGIHTVGIVHRDLKPSNVILAEAGPRVIDFGIARALDSNTALTGTNHVIGTRGFLAPEQLTGAPVTSATDLYAFGMVLCHAAGVAPFEDGLPTEDALTLLPANLNRVVTRCLDHDPAKRPTAAEALEQLTPGDPRAGWLPPPVRTMVDMHNAATVTA